MTKECIEYFSGSVSFVSFKSFLKFLSKQVESIGIGKPSQMTQKAGDSGPHGESVQVFLKAQTGHSLEDRFYNRGILTFLSPN